MISLDSLNTMNQAEFTNALGGIFEQTPQIAEQAWFQRPFSDLVALHQTMIANINSLNPCYT